jgi:hypothetical protein
MNILGPQDKIIAVGGEEIPEISQGKERFPWKIITNY